MYIEPLGSISLPLSHCVCVCLSALLCVWACAHLLYKRSEQKHMGCVGVFWQRTATLPPLQQNQETLHFASASEILGTETQIVMSPLQSRRILWRGGERHASRPGLPNAVQPRWLLTLHRVGPLQIYTLLGELCELNANLVEPQNSHNFEGQIFS